MNKKLIEKIEYLHKQDKHQKIIELIYSINEDERDYEIISLLARAFNNVQNYDEALDNLMYIREDGLFDPLWYFRTGYAYYYKNDKETAKQYFNRTIEILENDNKIIDNTEDILNSAKRLYSLCFEYEYNKLNFIDRIELFWQWFEKNELEIENIIKYEFKNINAFLSNGLKIINDNLVFNIGKDHNFTFNIDGRNYLFYLLPRIIYSMPERLKEKWSFFSCLPSSNGVNFTVEIHDKKIEIQDVFIKIEFDEENDKFDLIFYNKQLNELNNSDMEETYNIFFLIMENSIGEALSRIYIRYVDISDKKLTNMIPLTELEEYMKKTLSLYRKEIITDPINQYFSYTFEPKDSNILRYDIIAGSTSYYETINDYYNENIYDMMEISKFGAKALFLYYPYDDENDNEDIRRKILKERYEIQDRLKKEVLGNKEIGIVLGEAMGIYNIYIDLIIYDENEFIKRAKILLAEYDRNFYISKLIKYSEIKNIFDL
ncbi:hypothetical protein [Brachyspira sp.]|uniref:hypothetical protein n=1 Tax=Brachyspira sp. TaxID=1977261 RepID=UPI0026069771|nr:hypothetical protein [Brachyspira sp.]